VASAKRSEERLADATVHATKFWDGIRADFSAGRCRWCARLWLIVGFLLDFAAPIALTNDTTAGRGCNGWIGRSTPQNISHADSPRAVCSCIETDFTHQCEGEIGWN